MSVGPIPVSKMWEHCARRGYTAEMTTEVVKVMQKLDEAYLNHVEKQAKKKN